MNFWYQRTALQAFGWYLVFFLIGLPIAALIGNVFIQIVGSTGSFAGDYALANLPGRYSGSSTSFSWAACCCGSGRKDS